MSATILFWRHGQTDYNALGRLQGQIDIPLNDEGRAQAAAAAPVLAQTKPVRIVSSDLVRAHATASVLGELTGLAVDTDVRLRERSFGKWEGLTHAQIQAQWPTEYEEWNAGGTPDGIEAETRADVGSRIAHIATELSAEHALGEVVVLVAHGAAIGAGLTALFGQDPENWRAISGIGNCHWSVVQPNTASEPAWRLTAHNLGGGPTDFPHHARIV